LFGDGFDFTRRDALYIHLSQCQLQGSFTACAAFESRRVEIAVTDLWNAQVECADSGAQAFRLKAVGIVAALWGALVRLGAQKALALKKHGGIQENPKSLTQRVTARLI
jgi:hypothetical protein